MQDNIHGGYGTLVGLDPAFLNSYGASFINAWEGSHGTRNDSVGEFMGILGEAVQED